MEKGYFNAILTSNEIALTKYISNYIKEHDGKNLNSVRLAKIIVSVVLKLNLPIRLIWKDMGLFPVAQPQVPNHYDLGTEYNFIEEAIKPHSINNLDKEIKEAASYYGSNLTVYQIRRRQYEFLKDTLYLSKLDLEEFIKKKSINDNKELFLDLISNFIINIPKDKNYSIFLKQVYDYSVFTTSILYHTNNNIKSEEEIKKALTSLFDSLEHLNSYYKKLDEFDKLFTISSSLKKIKQKEWESKNAILSLNSTLKKSKINEDLSLGDISDFEEDIFNLSTEILLKNESI